MRVADREREGTWEKKCPCSNSSSFRPATAWCKRVWITQQISSRVCCCLLSIRAIRQWHHKTHQQLQVSEKTWREGLRLLIDTFSSSLYCQGRHAQLLSYSLNFSHMPPNFSVFSPLSIYPSKPSSISISSRAKLKWAEECWEKVGSHIWNHQGKTCQSFWCGAGLWLWEWAVTISGAGKVLSHQGKALKTAGCKGLSLLDLISKCPINRQACTASLWALEIGLRGRKTKIIKQGPPF